MRCNDHRAKFTDRYEGTLSPASLRDLEAHCQSCSACGSEWTNYLQAVEALRNALVLLSEREQEIIRLRFVAGLTNRAIGKTMGLREGNVAVILFRALRKLRRILEAEV